MNYSDYVEATWHHVSLDNAANDYSVLVHYARLAASSHNTQPWIFRLEPGRIRILLDLILRMGHGPEMPYSPRRPVEGVVE